MLLWYEIKSPNRTYSTAEITWFQDHPSIFHNCSSLSGSWGGWSQYKLIKLIKLLPKRILKHVKNMQWKTLCYRIEHEGFTLSKFFCDFTVAEMSVFTSVPLYLLSLIWHPKEEMHIYGRKKSLKNMSPDKTLMACLCLFLFEPSVKSERTVKFWLNVTT